MAPSVLRRQELSVHEVIFLNVTQTYFEMFAGTIMCYGQTGAGKTYTMTGATENYKHRGILPRALQQVENGPVLGRHTAALFSPGWPLETVGSALE